MSEANGPIDSAQDRPDRISSGQSQSAIRRPAWHSCLIVIIGLVCGAAAGMNALTDTPDPARISRNEIFSLVGLGALIGLMVVTAMAFLTRRLVLAARLLPDTANRYVRRDVYSYLPLLVILLGAVGVQFSRSADRFPCPARRGPQNRSALRIDGRTGKANALFVARLAGFPLPDFRFRGPDLPDRLGTGPVRRVRREHRVHHHRRLALHVRPGIGITGRRIFGAANAQPASTSLPWMRSGNRAFWTGEHSADQNRQPGNAAWLTLFRIADDIRAARSADDAHGRHTADPRQPSLSLLPECREIGRDSLLHQYRRIGDRVLCDGRCPLRADGRAGVGHRRGDL